MKYALGNMLNGAGGLNADGLSLDLPFAATKSLTARKGPTPVFTRSSTGTFVGSNGLIQSAAVNEPRFDHDPVTLASRGLLIEESRTNLLSRSEEFNETAWLKLRSSISANSTTSPSGDNSADKLIEDSSFGTHMTYRTLNTGSLVAHTFSVYAKADGRNFIYLSCGDGFPANSNAFFNLSNGTLGNVGTNATASITAFGNGWYRCSVTATPTSTTTNGFYIQTASANGTVSYQGDGTSGIFIWGAQLEAGSFPTSYIPTTTASVVRSADVCSITGSAFGDFYNQPEGTLFGSGIVDTVGIGLVFPFFLHLNDGTANNRIILGSTNSGGAAVRPIIITSGSNIYNQSIGTVSAGQSRKVALAYKANDYMAAANSQLAIAGVTGSPPSGLNQANINSSFFVGTISQIRYYRKRLPNAKLQALTA